MSLDVAIAISQFLSEQDIFSITQQRLATIADYNNFFSTGKNNTLSIPQKDNVREALLTQPFMPIKRILLSCYQQGLFDKQNLSTLLNHNSRNLSQELSLALPTPQSDHAKNHTYSLM